MGIYQSNHIQGKKGSQFSQQIRGLNLEQVLLVAIDAAKLHQKAMICNYFGDVIARPFFFSVNITGLTELTSIIEEAKAQVDAQRVFVGIEATGHYYEDIVRELGKRGYGVTIINAATTHEERASALSWCKTDDIDLVAIAHALKNNKGTENTLPEGKHRQLMVFTRARRREAQKRAALRMEARVYMDVIWREFQGYAVYQEGKPKKKTLFSDFWGKSSMFFMEHYPHPSQILALGEQGLRELSKKHNLKLRATTVEKLLHVASQSLLRSMEELQPELLLLKMKIDDIRHLDKNINRIEKEIEMLLLQTDGYLLLTVPGIGVMTAAEFYSELGNVSQYSHAGQLIKKAGTNPIVKQSGGGRGYYGRISKQGNRHLRYIVYLIGKSLVMHNDELRPFYLRLKESGKHPRKIFIAMGNKFIKIAFAMLRNQVPFSPKRTSLCIQEEMTKKLKYTTLEQMPFAA